MKFKQWFLEVFDSENDDPDDENEYLRYKNNRRRAKKVPYYDSEYSFAKFQQDRNIPKIQQSIPEIQPQLTSPQISQPKGIPNWIKFGTPNYVTRNNFFKIFQFDVNSPEGIQLLKDYGYNENPKLGINKKQAMKKAIDIEMNI